MTFTRTADRATRTALVMGDVVSHEPVWMCTYSVGTWMAVSLIIT